VAILRLSGDIGTKARGTQARFRRRLARNLADALAGSGALRMERSRLFVEDPGPEALDALSRVFGVQSLSLAEVRPGATLEDVVRAGDELFRERVRGRRFAVRARRVGEHGALPYRGADVERALGAALFDVSAGVDLETPEVWVGVELYAGRAYFFGERIPGPGGLPLGVEGRGVALVSGGFDSMVAAWHLLRRGLELEYVFCNLGGATHLAGVLRVAKVLAERWSYGLRPRLHAVDFQPLLGALGRLARPELGQVVLKRLMLRAGAEIARATRAEALVTGEALGQVSSQTLRNLAVITRATELPVLRPLVGFHKDEIIALSRRIGTHDLSEVVGEYCAIVPRRPSTGASLGAVRAEEEALDPELLRRAVDERVIFDLRALDPDKVVPPGIEVESIPEEAILIDLRSKGAYDAWHHPAALRLDFAEALRAFPHFARDRVYVLTCEFGLLSAHLAELMRRERFDAYHFKGGLRALRRYAEQTGNTWPGTQGRRPRSEA
jgi:thiamine biosynthesis protein ThiI